MRIVIQRVQAASVSVAGKLVNKIEQGIVIFLGLSVGDTKDKVLAMIHKVLKLRIFTDSNNKTNLDIFAAANNKILLISQFTLMANLNLGNRPSFTDAMPYEEAKQLYEFALQAFNNHLPTLGGVFGADMAVSLVNDGPFTLIWEV